MHEVGHYLQLEAVKKTGIERDQFARSAYNRYYYAAFLDVRSMLAQLDPRWGKAPHKSYPELLNGSISRTFKKERRKATKHDDLELLQKLDAGNRATVALASLMALAYATRVVADYEPLEHVDFTSAQRFSLRNVEITEAHDWEDKVRLWTRAIKEAWRQFNV